MSFSLLAPLALGLSVLVALPLLAHLARQTPREKVPFGAMLLLQRVMKRLRRRRRLKDPLILLLRVCVLLAIVAAAAGPRFSYPGGIPEHGAMGRVVLVIDRSLSMSMVEAGNTLIGRARSNAADVLSKLPDSTKVGLVVFDDQAIALTSELSDDHARIRSMLEGVQPTHGTSNLMAALHEARRLLAGEPGEVLVFSDEAGPRIVREAQSEIEALIERGNTIVPLTVKADPARNVAITSAVYGSGVEGGSLTIRLANYGPDAIEVACEIILPDGQTIPIFAELPPSGEAEERLTIPQEALGGVGVAVCKDPDLPADDSWFFHLPRVGASKVLVVDGDPGDTPTRSEVYFLERALAPWGGTKSGVSLDVTAPAGLSRLAAQDHRVVFLCNVSDPRPYGPLLTEFVRQGGNLVITAGNNVTAERYNAALGSVLPAPIRKARSIADREEPGVPLALPDATHDLFAAFSRSGRAGFAKVRAHRILTLEPYEDGADVTTLLRYEGGAPALIERRIGAGRVLLWTSTVDWTWSNLPLQSVFMPLTQQLVRYLGGDSGSSAERFDGVVGRSVRLPLPELASEPDILGPDGHPVAARIDGSSIVFKPDEPGAYQMKLPDAPPLAWIAVNIDPTESDVRASESLAAVERELDPERFIRHADLAPPLLGLALFFFLLQALLSARGSSDA